MHDILRHPLLSQFQCLGERCEDTCCQTWSMQVDEATHALYAKEAPELLEAVEPAIETPWVMRKNPQTGFCVKLEGGLCGIHKARGDRFLGDACHFYPRVTRRMGNAVLMSATLSCPEIARLALYADHASCAEPAQVERLPHNIRNYLPEAMPQQEALAVHEAFLNAAADKEADAEQIFLRIACASRQMQFLPHKSWAVLASFYLKDADLRIPPAQPDANDAFNLLHALCGLIVASHKTPSGRLLQTIACIEKALAARLDWQNVAIATSEHSVQALAALQSLWRQEAKPLYTPVLRRWLAMQVALSLHPFSGLGDTLEQRVTLLGMRFALTKLALLCAHSLHGALPEESVVRIVQSLSRFMDHLGDAAFSMKIAEETGWNTEARMHGLVRF